MGDKRGDEQRDKTIYVDSVPQENLLRHSGNICVCIVQHSDGSPPVTTSPFLSQDCMR